MRIDYLSRTGMYKQAFQHIIENDSNFSYKQEDYEKIEKTRKYDPTKGTTSPEFDKLCKDINVWLRDHYDMFLLDYTHFEDPGSRDEVILCYDKKEGMFSHSDFANELPVVVFYR